MKKKTKITIWLILIVLMISIGVMFFMYYNIGNNENISDKTNYDNNIKNLYLNNGNNENIEIPSQIDE